MPDLVEEILRKVARRDVSVITGTVSAINVTTYSLTIAAAAGAVSGIRWISTYAPSVGDYVVAVHSATDWVVLGKLSKSLTAATTATTSTVVIAPAGYWEYKLLDTGSSYWVSASVAEQGYTPFAESGLYSASTLGWWSGPILSRFPVGATVTSAKISMTRWKAPPGAFYAGGSPPVGAALVSPVLRLHAATSQPSSGGPPFLSGYGIWQPGQLAVGESASWDLPSSWLTAILAGTALGIGVGGNDDWARWAAPSMTLTITYTA